MLNLPRNDIALANVGAEPAYDNTYNYTIGRYSSFIGKQHSQLCRGTKFDYSDRLERATNHVAEVSNRVLECMAELYDSANKFQSPFEIRQGILSHACQEPIEVPYDLLLSIPIDTAGMDDVVRQRMMAHFRTLTIMSPTDDSVSETHFFRNNVLNV